MKYTTYLVKKIRRKEGKGLYSIYKCDIIVLIKNILRSASHFWYPND